MSQRCIQSHLHIIQSLECPTQRFQGLTEGNLTIIVVAARACLCPPGRYPQNWMGHENDIGVRAANPATVTHTMNPPVPSQFIFALSPLSVCIGVE